MGLTDWPKLWEEFLMTIEKSKQCRSNHQIY